MQSLKLFSLAATISTCLPSMFQMGWAPRKQSFLYGLLNCSLSFYLFSFQGTQKIHFPYAYILLRAVTEVFLVIKYYFFGSICSTWKIYSPATVACKLAGLGRALCFRVVNIQWLTFCVPTCYSRQTSCAIYCSIWSLHPSFSCPWRKSAETWERGHSLLFWYFEVISACLLCTAACCLLDYNPSKKVSFPFRSYHNAPLLLPVCMYLSLH